MSEIRRLALRALPIAALAVSMVLFDPFDLDSDADAGERGHRFPELGPLEADAQDLLNTLLTEDRRLATLGKTLTASGIPPTDPLMQKLASLNRWQDSLLNSVAYIKAELAVADMSGSYSGNTAATRGDLAQLRTESLGLSSEIDKLEAAARSRGIPVPRR
jgi:hypothetical protein